MPRISVVIPAYNKVAYLLTCLRSVVNQTFNDFEIVVVDDCSSDDTVSVIEQLKQNEHRIRLIRQETNQGTMAARVAGALATTGEYVTFMDQDDTLEPYALESIVRELSKERVDILHFGVRVTAANALAADAAEGMACYMNPKPRRLYGEDILTTVFSDDGYDWNVHHKVFDGNMMRDALQILPVAKLTRPDDACIYFAIASAASTYRAIPNARWYVYNLGLGTTLGSELDLKTFDDISAQDAEAYGLVHEFVEHCGGNRGQRHALSMLRDRLVEHTMNEWRDNIPLEQRREAFEVARSHWETNVLAAELYRFVRDDAYHTLKNLGTALARDYEQSLNLCRELVMGTVCEAEAGSDRLTKMEREARVQLEHLADARLRRGEYAGQTIRIFATTHKDVDVPARTLTIQPVQVGMRTEEQRLPNMFHDDEGENISAKNPMYCELTTQYWAWKNIDAEYYGFCHYRRYFDFSDTEHKENPYGEIMDDYIDEEAIRRYGLDDETIAQAVRGYDVITTRYGNLTKIIDGRGTPKKVWEAAPKLIDDDLHRMYDILCRMHPDYKQDAIAFLNGNRSCFCNMFIMRKPIFQEYCAWLFPLLEEFERCTDMSRYSKEALRTPGHLAERLLNIYLMHHKRIGTNWRTKELQCVHFTNPEPQETLQPLSYDKVQLPVVPVVFAADDNYVPQLGTTIYSAMANASKDRHYDVVVLQRNIAWDKQERLRAFFQQFDNMTLRFINVDRLVSGVNLTTNNTHISVETYYRFLIQQVLPFYDKVLYLDSDIIINGDIAELYDTELGENLLAAVPDIDFLGNLNVKHGLRMGYAKNVLHMQDPYAYFQAGVLVLNTRAMREHYTMRQWLEYASNPEYIYNDQDVLNTHCEGKVAFLDWSWNVMHDCAGRVANVFSLAPNNAYDAYMASREQPKIIHYAGFVKPWTDPDCDFASIYWRYARETPFYERLLKKVVQSTAPQPKTPNTQHERAIGEGNALRKVIDPLMPIGSKRRETAKAVGRLIRGKH